MVTRRGGALALLLSLVFLGALAFGALAVDPLGAFRAFQLATLRRAGAHEEFFAGSDGRRLHAWVVGPLSAEVPVVLLHGLGASSDYWTGTARWLVRQGRTVILPDAPGSGESEAPRLASGWGLPARVSAVRSLVSALGLSRVDLVGHSLGGWTAGAYALAEPLHVRRLVLVDAGGFFLPPGRSDDELRDELVPATRSGGRRLMDLLFFRRPFPVPGVVADALASNYRLPNVKATVEALGREDQLVGRESELPEGTVLVWGERETLFPVDGARAVLPLLRKGRLLVVRGVGHDGPLEDPGAFREALAAALEGRALTVPGSPR